MDCAISAGVVYLVGTGAALGAIVMLAAIGRKDPPPAEKFLHDLLDPEMYGHAVSAEVRDRARVLLGLKPVETTKGGYRG